MTTSRTPELWKLPAAAMQASLAEMAPDGVRGCEGVALWLGRRSGATAEITHVVALRGPGILKLPDHLSISPELLNEVTDVAIELDCYIVGQIHSHPDAWVDLSIPDQRYGIRTEGYLSVVAPFFAQRPDTTLADCGVHLFDGGHWRRLDPSELARRVGLGDGPVPVIAVGEVADE